jgi:DNA (cytosine-5)-methyltransferase 1
MPAIPVIDLFAGPGGLAEGFASLGRPEGSPRFRIALSIEKDAMAHQTLELRAFYRQFPHSELPEEYYEHLRGKLSRTELFQTWPLLAAAAAKESWNAELGAVDAVRARLLEGEGPWPLVGDVMPGSWRRTVADNRERR